jgi:hypothetical protein
MTGIDLFLTKCIYDQEQHPRHWDKYVYDDENIHYGILQLLAERSPDFAQAVLRTSRRPESISVVPQPKRRLFDLLFLVDGAYTYCEVKVWASLPDSQFMRQTMFLAENDAMGVYVLFTKSADAWVPEVVSQRSEGRAHVIGTHGLMRALDSIGTDLPKEVTEVAEAYRKALIHLNARWSSTSESDR